VGGGGGGGMEGGVGVFAGRWAGAGRAGGFAFLNVESNITDLIQHFKLLCGTSHKVVAILTPPVEGSMLCSCWRAIDHPQSCFGQ
jgi:hypothetical protein